MGQKTDSWVATGESRTFVFNFRNFLCGQRTTTSLFLSLSLCFGLVGPSFEKEKNRCNKVISFKLFEALFGFTLQFFLPPASTHPFSFLSLCVSCMLDSGSFNKSPFYLQHYLKSRKGETLP